MPKVLFIKGYRFFFFSNERNEPPHIHIAKDDKYAKFWTDPLIVLAENIRFRNHELTEIREMIEENIEKIREVWHGYFG